ncbi:MAG: hypothetical protein U0270_37205 [Labilithrix sp.]
MNPKDENKKPQPKHDLLDGIHFEPSTEPTKNEPTPERVREEKDRQSKK